MSTALKDVYSPVFYDELFEALVNVVPDAKKDVFLSLIFDKEWEARELKDRMKHTSKVLHEFLPDDFEQGISTLIQMMDILIENGASEQNFAYMFFPDYVEQYGLEHVDISLKAMERITQFTSCEFAIRPFLLNHQDYVMDHMLKWSRHAHENVRRFASEGCRPRLPWAMALPELKKDPSSILPILENLKQDKSEFVRRSVANNLNDISKDHPQLTLQIAADWSGQHPDTDRLIKHGLRTLLKQGNRDALELIGYSSNQDLAIEDFRILTSKVNMGNSLEFAFELHNKATKTSQVRLEYAMYYLRANGSHSKKVFKISEKEYSPASQTTIVRKQSFRPITTRTYYVGTHYVSVIVNGVESERKGFELLPAKSRLKT